LPFLKSDYKLEIGSTPKLVRENVCFQTKICCYTLRLGTALTTLKSRKIIDELKRNMHIKPGLPE
jgi:hypothetical protein